MQKALSTFLAEIELDQLAALPEKIGPLSTQEQGYIRQILQSRKDIQGVANLLMYPLVIPEEMRLETTLRALKDTANPYCVLAAVVGCQNLPYDEFTSDLGIEILHTIVEIIHQNKGIIAQRASVILADKLWFSPSLQQEKVIALLNHEDRVVVHNCMVALIPMVGLENFRKKLNDSVQKGLITEATRINVEARLQSIRGFHLDNSIDDEKFDLGSLKVPLLSYVPNYQDWIETVATDQA